MKILHLLGQHNLPKKPDEEPASGVVRVALEVARRQVAAGHQVSVAVVNFSSWTSTWEGVRLIGLKSVPWAKIKLGGKQYDFSSHLPYILYTWRNKVDIIHSHSYSYLRFLPAGGKFVHFHGDPFYRGSRDEGLDLKPADFRVLARYSDAQIAVSQFVGNELSRGLDGLGNIHVIHNGVDGTLFSCDEFISTRDYFRAKLNFPQDGVIILFSGAVTKEKGVIHLARVFHDLAREHPNLYLMVAGSSQLWGNELSQGKWQTAYEEEVRTYLKSYTDDGRVLFLGKIPYKEMSSIYFSSDLVVVPSIWKEAFPLAALEALAAGRPVVASSIGGLIEVVDNQTGILVEPGDEAGLRDAILRLALDSKLRERLGLNARRKAENFSWDTTAQRIEQLYRDVLSSN
jgi:glycosyltransferase involved in cell wall biosynthesis